MDTALVELSHKMEYDIRLVNDDLDEAVAQLVAYVNNTAADTSPRATSLKAMDRGFVSAARAVRFLGLSRQPWALRGFSLTYYANPCYKNLN